MDFTKLFSFKSGSTREELPSIFPFAVAERDFVSIDLQNIYARILTDVLERTQGISDEQQALLWDNCVASEAQDGLVTMLAKAMVNKKDLFLVYRPELKIVREALEEEKRQIREDYQARNESAAGVFITFKNFTKTDMLKIYSVLEYCAVASLNKQMNLSKALQIKISEMRASTGLTDSKDLEDQAKAIAEHLGKGLDVMIDAKDILEMLKPDMTATQAAMDFIAEKRSFYLGLPASWITGAAPKGLGDSGKGNAKDVERGLKGYYFAIVKPVLETLFKASTSFKSEDFDGLATSLEALKTFDITSDDHLSKENKTLVINKLFGLPQDEKGDREKPALTPAPPPARDVTPAAGA